MNTFKTDDLVRCKANNRSNGKVLCIFCGICESCRQRMPFQCTSHLKDRVLASFVIGDTVKRFKYHYWELELQTSFFQSESNSGNNSTTVTSSDKEFVEQEVVDFSSPDIKKLANNKIDIPLIFEEDFDDMSDLEKKIESLDARETPKTRKSRLVLTPCKGMILDEYLRLHEKMVRPI